jgi:WD40 repeat protein
VTLAELAGDDLTPVAHALAEHRLLSIDDGFVEVSHEALLREWPRLRDWLAEDAEGRRLSLRLERAASEWDEGNRDPAALIRGGGLVAAREWCGVPANARRLSPLAATFVDASDAAERSEIERRRRAARRLGGALVATVLLLLAVAVVGVVAFAQRGHARRAALAAEAGRLGAQALVEPTLDRSLLLAREAVNLDDTPATESDLLAALLRSPRALSVLRLSDKPLIADALSPDGRTLAAMTADGRVYFVDTATMRRVGSTYETAQGVQYAQGNLVTPMRSLAFSPNGRTLAVGSSDGSLGLFALLDVKTHAVLARRVVPGQIVADVVYRPGGGMLVTGEQVRCCTRREVVALRSLTGAVIRRSAPLPHGRVVGFFDGNRAILVTEGPSKAVLLNARTLAVERTLAFGEPAVIAADEEHVAFAEPDGTVETRDLRSPRAPRVLGRPSFPVALGFGADGKVLAVSSSDGTVSVWDTRSGTPLSTLTGHTAEAQVPLVDTAAGAVLAVGHDGQLIAWDISGRHGFEHSFVAPGGPGTVASSRALIATASKNHVMLRDGRTLRRVRTLAAAFGDPSGVALSANGRFAAAVGTRAGVVWNVASGRVVLSTQPYLHGVNTVAFSPDETWVAFGGLDARSGWRIYRLASRKMIRDVRGSGPSTANISFSRDGRLLAVTDLAGGVSIEQATGNEFVVAESVGVGVYAIAFSPDDSLFATGDQNGDVRLWSTRTGNEVGAPFNDHGGLVTGVVFDPKGSTLATSSGDGKLRIWNVATRKLVGSPLPGGGSGVAFYPDGSSLFGVSSRDGSGTVWPLDPAVWESISCKIAHRNLTRAEWAAVLPDRPYRAVCRAG